MAKNCSTVYLGYEDEEITPKHVQLLNSTINKAGGIPDWPATDIKVPHCPLCGLARPLILQLYAPLEQSIFHRTFYIFACLSPSCSQNAKSWLCIRTQHLDCANHGELSQTNTVSATALAGNKKKRSGANKKTLQKINWCSGVDDWSTGDDFDIGNRHDAEDIAESGTGADVEQMDTEADLVEDDRNEENGNVVAQNDNSPIRLQDEATVALFSTAAEDNDDDEDDESNSMENELVCGFGHLDMQGAHVAEDPNANCASAASVATGIAASTAAVMCAEIEGGETDVVFVETPKKPERDLVELLKKPATPAALSKLSKVTDVTLKSFFIAVDIEVRTKKEFENYEGALSAEHIRELYQDYKRQDELRHAPHAGDALGGCSGAAEEQESYEKAVPIHGDMIFHQFISTIQQNPGQILRYSRDTLPLLSAPLAEPVPKCQYCNGETICEVQILPTLIPKLRLQQTNEPAPIEFGNVLIFSCLKNCWDTPDKMRYERIVVQTDN